MDWPLAISKNRNALRSIIAALFALAGFTAPGPSGRNLGDGATANVSLPRHILAAILLVLRPAESAVRRLILIAAMCRNSGTVYSIPRAFSASIAARLQELGKLSPKFRAPTFALLDKLKSFDPAKIWNVDPASKSRFESGFDTDLDPFSGFRAVPDQQAAVSALQIIQRLFAVGHALETLPAQARRLLGWQARRDAALRSITLRRGPRKAIRITALRPGLPPGWRQRSVHKIDDLLKECHRLAIDLMNAPNTG